MKGKAKPQHEWLVWDERYGDDPDRANCLSVEPSLKAAKDALRDLGYPGYIEHVFIDANRQGVPVEEAVYFNPMQEGR